MHQENWRLGAPEHEAGRLAAIDRPMARRTMSGDSIAYALGRKELIGEPETRTGERLQEIGVDKDTEMPPRERPTDTRVRAR